MKNKKGLLFFSIIFIFLMTIFCLSPISGDDWGNYLEGSKGIYHSFSEAIGMYFSWEGRIVSRVLINILTVNKFLWNIINAGIITITMFYINKLIKPKNKYFSLLLIVLMFLLVNIYIFSQSYVWVAGNITYLFPACLLIIYIVLLFNNLKINNKFLYTLLIIFNIVGTMFVEHMAVLIIITNIFFIGYKYHLNKRIDYKLLILLILSILTTLLMFISPGNAYRISIENVSFNQLSIIYKVLYNIPNFIYYTYIINGFMLILMVISFIVLIRKLKINKYLKILLMLITCLIPVLTIGLYYLNYLNIKFLPCIIDQNNIILTIYYILVSMFLIYLIIREKNVIPVLFVVLGFLSNAIMLISPVWGYRTSLATYLLISIGLVFVIDKNIKERKIYNYCSFVIVICMMMFYLVLYINVIKLNNEVKSIIDNSKEKKEISLPLFPSYVNCNINPLDEYHLNTFKKYYRINDDVKIDFYDTDWKYLIFYVK